MKFNVEITIMPLKELLDPQGRAAARSLSDIHIEGIEDLRIGKHIHLTVDAADEEEARRKVEESCKRLLANPIMESYQYEVHAVS